MEEKELWHVRKVTAEEYESLVPNKGAFFNEPRFTELNKNKADEVYYLILMRAESARFGVIVGKIGTEARCPFSAPYSYPVAIIGESKQETIDAGLIAMEEYLISEGIRSIRYIFPPLFYDEHLLSGWVSAFYRNGYRVINLDISYALNLDRLNVSEEQYGNMITAKGRKSLRNLNISLNQYFEQLKSTDLFQLEEKIQQSDIMASLNASSVNTIRCNAFVTRHGVKVPFAFLKVGRAGSFVDNGGKGGILVGIDEKTGVLNTDGRDEYGNRYVTHPDSNIRFQDFRLPDWEDALQLCNEITPKVTGVQAIGWDLAHTAQGWVIVEGNLFSQFVGPQITREQGLKKEWLAVMEDMELL